MGANFLNLNKSKTKIIIFGKTFPALTSDALGPLTSKIRTSVRNLGVIFDSNFKFEKQVGVVRNNFFQLRILTKLKNYLSLNDLATAVHAFVISRLDYCNTLYINIEKS